VEAIIMRFLLAAALATLLLFLALQLLPLRRDHENPPVVASPAWNSPATEELFVRACADCHSNQTVWPWYSNVAPMSWLVQRDVEQGRAVFNISTVDPGDEAEDAAETVIDGEMPPLQYMLAHPAARLNAAEREVLVQGLLVTFGGEQDKRGRSRGRGGRSGDD
jgi:mono/diheme cytochrome c family protein